MLIRTVILFLFIAIFIGISQTTGPIINMLLMMAMGYKAKLSTSFTYLLLAGGSIASIWKYAAKKNPKTGKSYVKMDLILLSIPSLSSGALFGGIFKNFLSQILITFLFIILFTYMIYDICKQMKQQKANPHAEMKQEILIQLQELNKPMNEKLVQSSQNNIEISKAYIQYEARPGSKNKLLKVVLMCVFYTIFTIVTYLIKGSKKYHSIIGIDSCGGAGWVVLFAHLCVSAIVSSLIASKIISDTQGLTEQQTKKYTIQVTHKNVWYFFIAGFAAGFLGALMAIGSTLLLVPAWIKIGVDKNYAGASSSTLILVTYCISLAVAYFNHYFEHVQIEVIIFYIIFSFVCAAIMKDIIAAITKKFKLQSMVLVLLLVVLISTLLALVPFQIGRLLTDYRKVVDLGYLC